MPPSQRFNFILASALLIAASSFSHGSEVTDHLKSLGMKEYVAPLSQDLWSSANRSSFEYLVEKEGNGLVVHEIERRLGEIVKGKESVEAAYQRKVPPAVLSRFEAVSPKRAGYPSVAFKAGSITYVGTDSGEFGGGLYALRESGKLEELLPDNVVEILHVGDELLVFTGLDHLGSSTGSVWSIKNYRTKPRIERLTLLPGTPDVALKAGNYFQDSLLVVTSEAIIELGTFVELQMHIDTIDAFWSGLYPTSAVQIGTELVIGMRGGVAVFTLPTFFRRERHPVSFFANQEKNSAQ